MSGAAWAALFGLAVASFAAATPLPVTSEPLFIGLMFSDLSPVWLTVLVASVTNTAGSVISFLMARAAGQAGGGKWMPISSKWRDRLEVWYKRWGLWSLILSWIPGGDLLVIMAGFAKARALPVVVILTVAKTVRFIGLAVLTLGVFVW